MRSGVSLLCCGLYIAAIASAQPAIYPRGVVNAASSTPNGLSNGSIAQGSLFTIYGTKIGPTQPSQAASFPLSTSLGGVTITIGQGASAVKVIPYYVSATQVNAIMPSNAPLGLQPIYVVFNGTISNPSPIKIVPTSFNFFSFNGAGSGTAAALNFTASGGTFNSPQATAKPGQVVVAYGTGLGPIPTPDAQPAPGNSPTTPIQVFVGGVAASVAYSGRAPGTSGEDQINFTIPANAPTGCWVPVYAVANGITSNAVTLAIDANGAPCSDAANPLSQAFISGKKLGLIQLIHTDTLQDMAVASTVTIQNDLLVADFGVTPPVTPWPFATLFSQPPPGACTLIQRGSDILGNDTSGAVDPETSLGLPSNFNVNGGGSSKQVMPAPGSKAASYLIGSAVPGVAAFPNQLFLAPGSYTVSAAATGSIGAVQASITMPAPFTWTGRSNLGTVPRSTPLNLSWSGLAANQYMAIFGGDVDFPTNSSSMFYCLAPAGASSFTVPSQILSAVPATRVNAFQSKSAIYMWTTAVGNGAPISVSGVDSAYGNGAYVIGKTVVFQ
jgi:uncharacterized protein (TIGR03437 family)